MPDGFNTVSCGDAYTTAATIQDVWESEGGWISVAGAAVLVQLQWGTKQDPQWSTLEQELGVGAFVSLPNGCSGVRFRNATAGKVASVTAWIARPKEPALQIATLGTIALLSSPAVTRQIFTASGAYTIPAGVTSIIVECVGSGGGGGGVNVTTSGQVAVAGGGGGGSYAAKVIPVSAFVAPGTLVVNVGLGGSGGSGAANGGAGDVSNLDESGGIGFWVQAKGGGGGQGRSNLAAPMLATGGVGGGGITGPNIGDLIIPGGAGGVGIVLAAGAPGAGGVGGYGGAGAVYGAELAGTSAAALAWNGANGQSYGGGGSGAGRVSSTGSQVGGLGADGVVVITELYGV